MGEAVDAAYSLDTLILASALVSDTLTLMLEACIISETDLVTGTSGGVKKDEVGGGVESVKIVVVNGTYI